MLIETLGLHLAPISTLHQHPICVRKKRHSAVHQVRVSQLDFCTLSADGRGCDEKALKIIKRFSVCCTGTRGFRTAGAFINTFINNFLFFVN